jgi:hypothetical protein
VTALVSATPCKALEISTFWFRTRRSIRIQAAREIWNSIRRVVHVVPPVPPLAFKLHQGD